MADRTPRSLETRSVVERPKQWAPPELLPEPDKQPGFAYRWIRVSTLNMADPRNVSAKLREGWEPVKASMHPEVHVMAGSTVRFPDSIEIGGLLLCKTPVEMVDQRNEFFQKQTDAQMQSVDNNFMRQNDARMPLFQDRQSKVTFGRGNI